MSVKGLDKIFKPRSIAVIGASNTEGSVGYMLLHNLIGVGYFHFVRLADTRHPSLNINLKMSEI
ncbi:MAG: hypothetical protein U9N46_05925 [Euryarchaeota archaeon]|nr:hypothetical protein [Euryarchaeota archaeon]